MKKMFLFAMLTILMGACTEYIEDATLYTADPEGLVIHVTDSNSLFGINEAEGSTRAVYNGITTSFENGDSIGIYAVQGSTVKHSNIKVVYNSGVWVPTDFIKFNKNYTYYAYFPYRSTGLSSNFALSGVDNIFGAGISAWPISTDQSTYQNFKNCDLMLAAGVNTSDNIISFTMQHKMALAVLKNNKQCTYSYSTNPTNKISIANSFIDKFPYLNVDNNKYYYIMKPNTSTTIGGTILQAQTGKYIEKNLGDITEAYSIKYSTDNGETYSTTKPSWVDNVVETRDSGEPLNFCFFVNDSKTTETIVNQSVSTENHFKFEQAQSVEDYDLSTDGGSKSMTTANCYMIHAAGSYKLPLVYGNAIKNGQLNEIAYKPLVSGTNVLSVFVNHNNDPITAPWITKSTSGSGINKGMNINVNKSGVVWQTQGRPINSIEVDGDYLKFNIKKEIYGTEHAVVAIYDNNDDVIWSWYLWITGENWNDLISVLTENYTYNITPTPLGWSGKPVNRKEYQGSTCKVQISSGSSVMALDLIQPNNVSYEIVNDKSGSYTYFQWGKKDPEPAFSYQQPKLNTSYWYVYSMTEDGVQAAVSRDKTQIVDATISTKIKNPKNFGTYGSSVYDWASDVAINLWDAMQTSIGINYNRTIKTVYDPCPPGFCVPSAGLYEAFKNMTNMTYLSNDNYSHIKITNSNILNNNNEILLPCKFWYNYANEVASTSYPNIAIWFSNMLNPSGNAKTGYGQSFTYNTNTSTVIRSDTPSNQTVTGKAIFAVAEGN